MKSERLKKWIAGAVFGLLGLIVIGFSIKLAYDVMVILFPKDPVLKFMAIALFDGGVIGWLLAYIAKAKGTAQRGISLLMTVGDFLGVAAMAIAGIYLGGQTLADIPAWVGGTVVVVTIIATVLNAGSYYYYHANAPEVQEAIQAQELEDTLTEEALDQARYQVERKAQELGNIMANRVTARLKYRLRLPMTDQEHLEWQGETIDAESYDVNSLPPPPAQNETLWSAMKSFFGGKQSRRSSATQPSKNSTNSQAEQSRGQAEQSRGQAEQSRGQAEQESLDREQTAMNSSFDWAWKERPNGERVRFWCKVCKREGKPWHTDEPCEHILNAKPEKIMSDDEAIRMFRSIWDEENAAAESE